MRGYERYILIYQFLCKNFSENSPFLIDELATFSGLKLSTIKVYIRNKLKNRFIMKIDDKYYKVTTEINNISEDQFTKWMSQKSVDQNNKNNNLLNQLLDNSIQSMLSAIEIHNKPQITYRYQVVVILLINSWELALKSYILKYQPDTKILKSDGTTKPFPECIRNVESNLGKSILPTTENLELLYKYRCNYIHFYNDDLDVMLFSLIQKSVIFYSKFISIYFNKDISDIDDLYILPIGFKKPVSPLDFISNKSFLRDAPNFVKSFFNEIIDKTERLSNENIDEMVFVPYSINLTNIKKVKNADIIAAISKNSEIKVSIEENVTITDKQDAKEVRIEEEDLYGKFFNLRFAEVVEFCKHNIPNFKRNNIFYSHMRELKNDPSLHHVRLLDPNKPDGSKKDFYSRNILNELVKRYN